VLEYWRRNCFEYSKDRPTAYPGQTCLNDWPERFESVRVITHKGAGVAPWNIEGMLFGRATERRTSILSPWSSITTISTAVTRTAPTSWADIAQRADESITYMRLTRRNRSGRRVGAGRRSRVNYRRSYDNPLTLGRLLRATSATGRFA